MILVLVFPNADIFRPIQEIEQLCLCVHIHWGNLDHFQSDLVNASYTPVCSSYVTPQYVHKYNRIQKSTLLKHCKYLGILKEAIPEKQVQRKALAKISMLGVCMVPQRCFTRHRFKNHSLLGLNSLHFILTCLRQLLKD